MIDDDEIYDELNTIYGTNSNTSFAEFTFIIFSIFYNKTLSSTNIIDYSNIDFHNINDEQISKIKSIIEHDLIKDNYWDNQSPDYVLQRVYDIIMCSLDLLQIAKTEEGTAFEITKQISTEYEFFVTFFFGWGSKAKLILEELIKFSAEIPREEKIRVGQTIASELSASFEDKFSTQ